MKHRTIPVMVLALLVCIAGCEWENVSNEDAWGEAWLTQYGWVAFSGMYRGAGPSGYLVSPHAYTAGVDLEQTTSASSSGTGNANLIPVVGEFDMIVAANQTSLAGTVTYGSSMEPGSLTIVMTGLASGGTFRDNGSGAIAGTFNLVGIDNPTKIGTGTVDYNTGVWTLALDSPGFLEPVTVTLNYSYQEGAAAIIATPALGGTTNALAPGNSGDPIYTMYVQQDGNVITMTDSSGATYQGMIGRLSTTAGTADGTKSGEVIANFKVKGVSAAGVNIEIVGTFSGVYEVITEFVEGQTTSGLYGVFLNRIIQGTWIESSSRRGDVLAKASSAGNASTSSSGTTTDATTQ